MGRVVLAFLADFSSSDANPHPTMDYILYLLNFALRVKYFTNIFFHEDAPYLL
jgi:hypothetical protein